MEEKVKGNAFLAEVVKTMFNVPRFIFIARKNLEIVG